MSASRPRDREPHDEGDRKGKHDSNYREPSKTADLNPIRSQASDGLLYAPGAGVFGHEGNLPRWIGFEALDALVLAYERDDSLHVVLGEIRDGWHVAEVPMVSGDAVERCAHERLV